MKLKKQAIAVLLLSSMIFGGCANSSDKNDNSIIKAPESSSVSETESSVLDIVPTIDEETATEDEDLNQVGEAAPLFWKVSDEDSTVYMLGSMHVMKEAAYPLPKEIEDAFASSEILAVEADVTDVMAAAAAQMNLIDIMMYQDGTTLENHLDYDIYKNVVDYLKSYNLYNKAYELYKPAMIYSLASQAAISDTDLEDSLGVDRHFLNLAKQQGKEVFEVESIEFQFKMLFEFPDEIFNILLEEISVENSDELAQQLEDLYELWCKGDLEEAEKGIAIDEGIDENELNPEQAKVFEEYQNAMYYDRNTHMTEELEELLSGDKDVFYTVGLAHFLGDKGIVSQLEQQGYTVEQITFE